MILKPFKVYSTDGKNFYGGEARHREASMSLTPEQIIITAGKYRIDHYGDYDRNSSEHTRDLISFAQAIVAAARAEAIEECAKKIEPKNSVEDWTEYAQARADAAADLRALLNTGEKT